VGLDNHRDVALPVDGHADDVARCVGGDGDGLRAVRRVPGELGDAPTRRAHQQARRERRRPSQDAPGVVGFGDQRHPGRRPRIGWVDADHSPAIGVEGGDADEPAAVPVPRERRHGLDPFEHRRPGARRAIEEPQVDAAPPQAHLDQQPAVVVGGDHARPRRWIGQLVGRQHHQVGGGVVAERVVADVAVVLVVGRIDGVGEAGAVGVPRQGAGAGVGHLVVEVPSGRHLDDAQRRPLVAAGRRAVGDEGAVGRRVVPVDGGGGVAASRGIDQDARLG
jgi:hypothetical protein